MLATGWIRASKLRKHEAGYDTDSALQHGGHSPTSSNSTIGNLDPDGVGEHDVQASAADEGDGEDEADGDADADDITAADAAEKGAADKARATPHTVGNIVSVRCQNLRWCCGKSVWLQSYTSNRCTICQSH